MQRHRGQPAAGDGGGHEGGEGLPPPIGRRAGIEQPQPGPGGGVPLDVRVSEHAKTWDTCTCSTVPDLAELLATPGKSLDGVTVSGDEARAQLGVELCPQAVRSMDGLHVAVYLRISDDRLEEYRGVRRQATDTINYVLARGTASVTIYEENDNSAFKKKRITVTDEQGNQYFAWRVIRPRWQAMLAALRSGVCTAACVYDLDRLARDNRDLEDAIELAEHYHRLFDGTTGSLDLNTDGGRAMARVLTAMNNKSSADTSRRQKRKHRELAEEGQPVGPRRPFGWKADKRTLEPAEAAEVRDAIAKIVAGCQPDGHRGRVEPTRTADDSGQSVASVDLHQHAP